MNHYESHGLQDKALPFIYKERKITQGALRSNDSNWHENVEILYITQGIGKVCNNGRILAAAKGDILPIDANHLHSLAAEGDTLCFRYLIIDRAFCLENGLDTSAISFDMQIRDSEICTLMEDLHTAYEQRALSPYGILTIRTLVLSLLLSLCRKYGTAVGHPPPSESGINRIKQAIDYVRTSYGKPLSLEEVAASVGVSDCYLSHEFRKYTGHSFVEYVNRTRCMAAEHLLLTTSLGVFEIGKRCGFENRSYFAKSFRRYAGMSPTEFRTAKKGN